MSLCAPKGKALVICGEEGSGKSSLAKILVNRHCGRIATCHIHDLTNKFRSFLAEAPEILIIEELTMDDLKRPETMNVIKALLCNDMIVVELQGRDSVEVATPRHVVICTTLTPYAFETRRFVTLTIGGKLCHTPS